MREWRCHILGDELSGERPAKHRTANLGRIGEAERDSSQAMSLRRDHVERVGGSRPSKSGGWR